jgi:hypothetical protein
MQGQQKVRSEGIVYFTQGCADAKARLIGDMWKALDNPWLSRTGTAVFLFGAIQTIVRWGMGLTLNVVGFAFLALGVALMLGSRLSKHMPRHKGYSPEERRQKLDDLYHPAADPRRELGEDCASMAMKIKVFEEVDAEARPLLLDKMAREIRDADPELDPEEARTQAEATANRRLMAEYQAGLQGDALKLFDAAHEQGEITTKKRHLVGSPKASDLKDLAGMFRAIARRLGCDVGEPDPETRLEQWARERLAAVEEIKRERLAAPADDDSYYRNAMKEWDVENVKQLCEGDEPIRPDLARTYRENLKTGEKEPGPRVIEEDGRLVVAPEEWERYYSARIAWLRRTLKDFQGAATA